MEIPKAHPPVSKKSEKQKPVKKDAKKAETPTYHRSEHLCHKPFKDHPGLKGLNQKGKK